VTALRLLLPGAAVVGDLDTDRDGAVQALADLYAYPVPVPGSGWVRATMIATVDGAVAGPDGRSGSIGTLADRTLFSVLRGLADVILVGAGTVRAERYRPPEPKPDFAERRAAAGQRPAPVLAVVTRAGRPEDFPGVFPPAADSVAVLPATADLPRWRAALGPARVLVAGADRVDAGAAVAALAARGLPRILVEGGPHFLGEVVAAGVLDEICLSQAPLLVAGTAPRVATGPPGDLRVRPVHLIECDGTLLGRWAVRREPAG
jgi:riboflavin biosynthesis pyrimidine reductase